MCMYGYLIEQKAQIPQLNRGTLMFKIRYTLVMFAVLLLLTGCSPKDDFDDYDHAELRPSENVAAVTEFEEYDGNIESITVFITNDSDKRFPLNGNFRLQKKVNDEWKAIKRYYDPESLISDGTNREMLEHSEGAVCIDLKEHVKLPLLPGANAR